jgi:succinoglycan biosynthesis protein ExoA
VSGFVDHGHHALFDRKIFLSLGGYDEEFSHNEDAEYDLRLAKAGHKIWMVGETPIIYFPRSSLSTLVEQYFNYGWGRASTFLKHRTALKARQMFPVAAFLACAFATLAGFYSLWALTVPALYLLTCLGAGIALGIGEQSICVAAFSGVAFVAMHMSWAAGFLWRLMKRHVHAHVSSLSGVETSTGPSTTK